MRANEKASVRRQIVLSMYERGVKISRIGRLMGVSTARARRIRDAAKWERDRLQVESDIDQWELDYILRNPEIVGVLSAALEIK